MVVCAGKAQTDAMDVLGQVKTAVKTMDSMERRASTITHQMNRLDTFRRTATLPLHETTTSLAEARSQVNRSYYEVLKAAQMLDQASVKDVKDVSEQEASVPVVVTEHIVSSTVTDGGSSVGELTPPPVDAKEQHAEPADKQTSMQVDPGDPPDGANEPLEANNQTDAPEDKAPPPPVSHASGEASEKEEEQWLAHVTQMRDQMNVTLSALQHTAGAYAHTHDALCSCGATCAVHDVHVKPTSPPHLLPLTTQLQGGACVFASLTIERCALVGRLQLQRRWTSWAARRRG